MLDLGLQSRLCDPQSGEVLTPKVVSIFGPSSLELGGPIRLVPNGVLLLRHRDG